MLQKIDPRYLKIAGSALGVVVFGALTALLVSEPNDEIPYNTELPPWGDEDGEELVPAPVPED